MKNMVKFILVPALFAAALVCTVTGCEPKDWDIILAAPDPVSGLEVAASQIAPQGDSVSIPVSYTAPTVPPRIGELYPDYSYDILFTYRKQGEPLEVPEYSSTMFQMLGKDELGTAMEFILELLQENLENGAEYIITAYVMDAEGQLSVGVDSDPFTASW